MEVIDIQCDSDLKAKFIEVDVSEFYKCLPARFENTRKLAYEIIPCLELFSLMKGNKSPIRSRITDVHLGSVLKLITANKISPKVGKMEWKSNAAHDWYRAGGTSTGYVLLREQQSWISRLKSGHLRTMTEWFQGGYGIGRGDTIPAVTISLTNKLDGMKVCQQKEILPRICLFKMDEETTNSTIEETFLETPSIRQLPGDKLVRVVHRSAPRNGTCTAFIEVDLKTFRALGVRGRIVVDGVILNFEESIRVRVCFRCCGFGHNSVECSRAPKCFHCCEDGHEGRACPSLANQRTSKCANCCAKGLPDKHEARASSCPILKSRALKF
ncbi:GTF2IRD2 [Cordylochernes scorpioides]|uniref:GTF2IRD2 n=1 Tax=Cordylochernes scorpioides TaxID=51811 RepID=A0ABY6JY44_9ARAC|nr:GTF2IRD2 [Cordylochernes scorpioides]